MKISSVRVQNLHAPPLLIINEPSLMRPHLLCFQVARQIEGDTLSFHAEVISSYTGVQTVF